VSLSCVRDGESPLPPIHASTKQTQLTFIARGPQNNIMRTQGLFIGLDSVPCALAAVVLNIWHPGWCFPKEAERQSVTVEKTASGESSSEEEV